MVALRTWYGLFIATSILTAAVPPLRFWALRKTRRNAYLLASDIFYLTASLGAVHNVIFLSTDVRKELRLRSTRPPLNETTIMLMMYTETFAKYQFAIGFLYFTQLWFIKAAFLTFFWNLYTRAWSRGWRRWTIIAVTVAVPVSYVALAITYATWCLPISWQWSLLEILKHDGAFCSSNTSVVVQFVIFGTNVLTDTGIIGLGIIVLRYIPRSRLDNMAFVFVCFIGVTTISAAIARATTISQTGAFMQQDRRSTQLISLQAQRALEWVSCLEMLMAQIAFALPSLRFLIRRRATLDGQALQLRENGGKGPNYHVESGTIETTRSPVSPPPASYPGGPRVRSGPESIQPVEWDEYIRRFRQETELM